MNFDGALSHFSLRADMQALLMLVAAALTCSVACAENPVESYYRAKAALQPGEEPDVTDLLAMAEISCTEQPEDPDAWLSAGLLRAARAKGLGMRGLPALKQAKRDLERSIALDSAWYGGYARAFLARLYLTVPRWPIAFGNGTNGTALLAEVLEDSPDSLAGHLYEGLRLKGDGRLTAAYGHLEIAATAELACECPSWQRYLQQEAAAELVR